ncbi:hypothetical protein ABB37_03312 [Leptomonas pyrrhocoris]|uniref:3'-5' exonuclease n=1 Tax=Leptomonas pyrrhocoris TaxID=157538 RepID=A0A0M9G4D7_LEPPY|nr:hypothetical protein ABB37_03312 [Leptomonas pyrrhocoris]KPA82190.1 hypothetical protein ABB37_03312 [Leptomonas pyrrhocoris]|eukprot:XP_015660629.1 hypothetical protein ABB37_03312 [Leptomonas pyrrhocoris]
MCGVFVNSSAAWGTYGEKEWSDMMTLLDKQPAHLRLMGVDSEWFRNSPLAVVQLATSSHCFVLHLSYFTDRRLPNSVKEALSDPSIIKCGVGVSGDVTRLQKEQNLIVQSVLDVAHYSVALGLHDARQVNLKVLAASVANLHIEKNKFITRSNWELSLVPSQINYAAEDALASFLVGEAIMRKAYEVNHMDHPNFSISAWLTSSTSIAAQVFKRKQREKAKEAHDLLKKEARVATTDHNSTTLAAQLGNGARVAVLDKTGNFLFECSPGRAKFYVMEKGLARITKHVNGNSRKATEIQFLFDPKVKTRLCMYNSLGACELQDHCPFAHGIDELQPEARAMLTSSEPSCACCLGTKGLLRHAITPPSFRKYLPLPYKIPRDDDYVPLCGQCNSVLRHYYDEEMKKCYEEAALSSKDSLNINAVAKCIAYARLLSDEVKLQKIPEHRQEELKNYICEHWEKTYFRDFHPDFVIGDPLELSSEFLKRLERIVPGDVRSKWSMSILIGDDVEKAKAFTQRWHGYCFQVCGMVEKESNRMSFEDWKAYRARSGLSQEDGSELVTETDTVHEFEA